MAIHFGNDEIKEIYVGSDKIKEVYHGSDLVWSGLRGYWVHKDTGVKTYFDLDDSSIVGGIMSKPSWALDCSRVQLPMGVTGLASYAFSNCTSLTSINIPEGVTSLGENCFYGCSSLTSITLPESVNSLGRRCLYLCSSLILATVLPATPPSLGSNVFGNAHASFNIKVRSPYVDVYKTTTGWSSYAGIISGLASKAPTILFKANEVNVGFKYFRGDGGYNITNAGIELSISNGTFSVVGTNLAYDVSEYSGMRVKYIQENSTSIETLVAIGLTNSPTTTENRTLIFFKDGSPGTYERESMFEFMTGDGVVDKYEASIFIQYQEDLAGEKPNAKITITEIEMI